jgi:hypothetical protein
MPSSRWNVESKSLFFASLLHLRQSHCLSIPFSRCPPPPPTGPVYVARLVVQLHEEKFPVCITVHNLCSCNASRSLLQAFTDHQEYFCDFDEEESSRLIAAVPMK